MGEGVQPDHAAEDLVSSPLRELQAGARLYQNQGQHQQLELEPRCIPPLRQDTPRGVLSQSETDPTAAERWQSTSEAFAASWKERCTLDHDSFTILMTSSNTRIKQVKKNIATFTSGKIPSLAAVYLRWI